MAQILDICQGTGSADAPSIVLERLGGLEEIAAPLALASEFILVLLGLLVLKKEARTIGMIGPLCLGGVLVTIPFAEPSPRIILATRCLIAMGSLVCFIHG